MKKRRIEIDRLSLDKETIARLNDSQLIKAAGGVGTLSCHQEDGEQAAELVVGSCCRDTCSEAI